VSNTDKLRDAGLIKHGPLPAEYENIVEGLSPDAVAELVKAKGQLDNAEQKQPNGKKIQNCFLPL